MRRKFILNAPAHQKSGVCTCVAFVLRDSLLSSSLQKGGFPRLMIDQWTFVVKSWEASGWALADKWFWSPLLAKV